MFDKSQFGKKMMKLDSGGVYLFDDGNVLDTTFNVSKLFLGLDKGKFTLDKYKSDFKHIEPHFLKLLEGGYSTIISLYENAEDEQAVQTVEMIIDIKTKISYWLASIVVDLSTIYNLYNDGCSFAFSSWFINQPQIVEQRIGLCKPVRPENSVYGPIADYESALARNVTDVLDPGRD